MSKSVFTIPASMPFAKTLASELYSRHKDDLETLSTIRILLPTRRACRIMSEAFLQLSNGTPLLLPRLQPLGDVDEEELSLTIAAESMRETIINLPPSISPMRRRITLTNLIMKHTDNHNNPATAMQLANALGRFMDQVYTEGLDFKDLADIVPEEFSDHWQITLNFLKILSEHWPGILEQQGLMDIAHRRDVLMRTLNKAWSEVPPPYPVIAAGSTGTIPATSALLDTIAGLEHGSVVLPGLDLHLDQESWEMIEETHPQAGMKHLLDHMNLTRRHVKPWSHTTSDKAEPRNTLASEIMRPAETSAHWKTLAPKNQNFELALKNLSIHECANEREEAQTIAIIMREVLETPNKTAALVTPDRKLARRVSVECARWNINIDDSAGRPLTQTPLGQFLNLCLQTCLQNLSPVTFLALLKHPLCKARISKTQFSKHVQTLEKKALRGIKPAPGFEGLKKRLMSKENTQDSLTFLELIEPQMTPFLTLMNDKKSHNFKDFLEFHMRLAETLAQSHEEEEENTLWSGEAGEQASRLISELFDHAHHFDAMNAHHYAEIFDSTLSQETVRPAYGTHPRLSILGQLEARMSDAGVLIMGGLNEGTWPPDSGFDPWMSRPMRKDFGLPALERSIGLAAHDFEQIFCKPDVIITRSLRSENAPTVPSRWLERLDTVLKATNQTRPMPSLHKHYAGQIDAQSEITPIESPKPKPPVDKRPRGLSVTKIETWLKDPYSIYANTILNLKKLDPLEKQPDHAERGKLLHNILHNFMQQFRTELPSNSHKILREIAYQQLEKEDHDKTEWTYFLSRFENIAEWFITHEKQWRTTAHNLKTEVDGNTRIKTQTGDFTLRARADRVDALNDEGAVIIDYKSGGTFSENKILIGEFPQLPLEAIILQNGGFADAGIPATDVSSLSYWVLSGGRESGQVTKTKKDLSEPLKTLSENLKTLIETFDDPQTPYLSIPRQKFTPRFNDYEHLSRIKEWGVLEDDSDQEAA